MPLLPADVQILPSTSTHIHLCSKAAAPAPASSRSTLQEDNDWLSAELRDGHTKNPNLELQEDGSRGHSAAKFLSLFLFCFVGKKLYSSGGRYMSYSVVSKKMEDFDSCRVCRLFSGLTKKRLAASFRAS
jgi:hypothetical protein